MTFKIRFQTLAILFIFLLITAFSKAQNDTIVVNYGDKLIDASFFENYTNEWKMSFFDKDNKLTKVQRWTDFGNIYKKNSQVYFHRIQEIYNDKDSLLTLYLNTAKIPSLKPVQNATFSTNGTFNYSEFKAEKVKIKGILNPKKLDLKQALKTLKISVYDWTLYGTLLASLDLKVGNVYTLPVFSMQNKNNYSSLIVSVLKEDTIETLSHKTFKTYKIDTNNGLVFWVTKQKPYVIQLIYTLPNGLIKWEMN
jgi:hypothetical protein